jgi:hypothetical protein
VRTSSTTTRVPIHYTYACNLVSLPIQEIAPGASKTLEKAVGHQSIIEWDQWFYGRTSIHWGKLYNHGKDNKTEIIREEYVQTVSATKWGQVYY